MVENRPTTCRATDDGKAARFDQIRIIVSGGGLVSTKRDRRLGPRVHATDPLASLCGALHQGLIQRHVGHTGSCRCEERLPASDGHGGEQEDKLMRSTAITQREAQGAPSIVRMSLTLELEQLPHL